MSESHRPDMPLNDLYQNYVNENPRVRSEHTRALIRTTVQQFNNFIGRPAVLADFSNATLIAFAEHRKAAGRAPRTIERELSKLSTLWRWAAASGWCEAPRFSVQKHKPPTPTAWSPEEMEKIFAGAADYHSTIDKLPANLVMLAIIRLAYDTGERATALLQVQWSDIDFANRWVTYRAETRKGGVKAADNVQRISRKTVKALEALRAHCQSVGRLTAKVFPQMHPTSIYGHLKIVLTVCGLPANRDCMLHKIRRTHATHLHCAGGDASLSLGHDSDVMTRGYYLDPRQTRRGYLADFTGARFRRLSQFWRRMRTAVGL